MRMTMKDTIANQKSDIDNLLKEIKLIITKNTESLRASPRLQNRNGNFSCQEKTLSDEKKSISIKDLEKESTESLIGGDEQTMGRIEHVHVQSLARSISLPKVEPEAVESSVSAKQLLDEIKAFEELLLKAKEKDATKSFSTLSETPEDLYDDNDFKELM